MNIIEQLLITELQKLIADGDVSKVINAFASYLITTGRKDLAEVWTSLRPNP